MTWEDDLVAKVLAAGKQGDTVAVIAEKSGRSAPWVLKTLRAAGIEPPEAERGLSRKKASRTRDLALRGKSDAEIGEAMGISRQAVHLRLSRLYAEEPGLEQKVAKARQAAAEKKRPRA